MKKDLDELIELKCNNCGKTFTKTKRYISRNKGEIPKYCSKECVRQAKSKKMVKLICSECGKEFERSEAEQRKALKKCKNTFCSQSCAAKYNNRKYPKRKPKNEICPICGEKKNKRAKACLKCYSKKRSVNDFELGHYVGYDKKDIYLTHKCSQIRKAARKYMENESKQEKVCAYCHNHEFDEILEVHHIKGILTFDRTTKISVINSDENLVWLCPNHHALLEKGIITLDDDKS